MGKKKTATWWWCLITEIAFYGAVIYLWARCYWDPTWGHYWNRAVASKAGFLIPQANSTGWAGSSFISLTVGLNLALVKFEGFLKSLEEIKTRWEKDVLRDLQNAGLTGAMADDGHFDTVVKDRVRELLEKADHTNSRYWRKSRWWAQRLMVIGTLFLFFQHSAGLIGLLMLAPGLAAWMAKGYSRTVLKEGTQSIHDAAKIALDVLRGRKAEKITEIKRSFKEES